MRERENLISKFLEALPLSDEMLEKYRALPSDVRAEIEDRKRQISMSYVPPEGTAKLTANGWVLCDGVEIPRAQPCQPLYTGKGATIVVKIPAYGRQ